MAEKMLKIPTQTEMYSIVLNMVKDGKEFRRIDIKKKLYKELGLDDAHIEKTSSGTPLATIAIRLSFLPELKSI